MRLPRKLSRMKGEAESRTRGRARNPEDDTRKTTEGEIEMLEENRRAQNWDIPIARGFQTYGELDSIVQIKGRPPRKGSNAKSLLSFYFSLSLLTKYLLVCI